MNKQIEEIANMIRKSDYKECSEIQPIPDTEICDRVTCSSCKIARQLIAEGVIVPPVKVGQMVYVMESENTGYYECKIVGMKYDGVQWHGYMNCLWVHHHGGFWEWQECDIGKTFFLTREEAEKELERRKSNA
jgi:hypothetical protein